MLVMLLFISCNAPTVPEVGQNYQLIVTASPSCPNSGQGSLSDRQFIFKLVFVNDSNGFTYQMPTRPEVSGPDSGSLTIFLTPTSTGVTGSISGDALSSDGVHEVGFFTGRHQGNGS